MRILATADIHIGRRSTRLPSHVDGRSTSSAAAWDAIVDLALARQVDVVAIAGDLVDHDNRFYEALGPLERGLRRLGEAGIDVLAVAGNHDFDVLPSLARTLPDGYLTLVGLGGQWERVTVQRGDSRLYVDGWSFPTQHVREAPLSSHTLPAPPDDGPLLGMLHGDLDQPRSNYAPISLSALQTRPASLWLLGHVHCSAEFERDGAPDVLYPGSPNPMDPGEPGAHGVWMLELRSGERPARTFIPVARVRYESLDVDLTDVANIDDLRHRLTQPLRTRAAELAEPPLEHLSFRLRLTGRTPLHRTLEAEAGKLVDDLRFEVNGAEVHVERVVSDTRPVRDLAALATGADTAAWLAGLLVTLDAPDAPATGASAALGAEASVAASNPSGSTAYTPLLQELGAVARTIRTTKGLDLLPDSHEHIPNEHLHSELRRQADLLLDELLAQKEAAT